MKQALASLRPAEEFALLEEAARSRSEADWIVGMNATRAATIRLRSSFDGAVSLGRVQTPTLAIVARREEEIKAFVPEPYWLVDATFAGAAARRRGRAGERVYVGPLPGAARQPGGTKGPRIGTEEEARGDRRGRARASRARSPSSRRKSSARKRRCSTTSRRCSARPTTATASPRERTLAAAQRLYEEHKALTYPRTNSRYLTTDMVEEIKPIAELVGAHASTRKGAEYVTGLDVLPLARVVNDEKVTDHHAIIPTRSEHPVEKMNDDDRRIYDMAVRRFLAVFHPEAVFENTRIETTVVPADGERPRVPHARQAAARAGLARRLRRGRRRRRGGEARGEDEEAADQQLPRLIEDEQVQTREIESARKETKPPRRYSDASLLGAMETAGKLVDDDELREAMKDSGIGTPATRAAIIERLITVGYIERDGRALVATEKGLNVIRLLGEHALTSPGLTGSWEQRLGKIERGEDSRKQFMSDIAGFADRDRQDARRDAQRRADPARAASARARSAATRSSRTARATPAGRARTRAAAS